jgi:phytoene dehydrogenase-like protein
VKEHYADRLMELAETHLPGLREHTVTRKIMTAVDYRKYTHMRKSSFGGVVPIWNQKNPPHESNIKGLYFVGQQSENGGGVCPVMMGAKAAWEKARTTAIKEKTL